MRTAIKTNGTARQQLLQADGTPFVRQPKTVEDWRSQRRRDAVAEPHARRQLSNDLSLRRWESAQSNRLNLAHWSLTSDTSINSDLVADLTTLRARCHWEMQNNAMLAGVAATYTGDLVGPHGPHLEVQSKSKSYNDWVEGHWRHWWRDPDLTGQLNGPDILRLWMGQMWPDGAYFSQIVTDPDAAGPVKMRLNNIAPRRVTDPIAVDLPATSEMIIGIERNLFGKPLRYHVTKETTVGGALSMTLKSEAIPAAQMLHGYEKTEADQAHGVPWFATSLQAAADTRDYSDQVMDAARAAADSGVFLASTDGSLETLAVNESEDIERRQVATMPPGWEPHMMRPEQPGTMYIDYMKERYRDYGRPRNMPLMMVMLDSQGLNYSGGRLDTQAYDRGMMVARSIPERDLRRLVGMVAQEAELADRAAGKRVPKRPDDVAIVWGWQPRPHVDPAKEATAIEKMQKAGNYTVADGLRLTSGRDVQSHIAMLVKEMEAYEAAGLTHPAKASSSPGDAAEDAAPASPPAPGLAKPAANSAPAGGPKAKDEDDA